MSIPKHNCLNCKLFEVKKSAASRRCFNHTFFKKWKWLGVEHSTHYVGNALLHCMLKTCIILLILVTPVHLINTMKMELCKLNVISYFLDGSWGSDPEDGKFAARLWTQGGAICPSSWCQSCTYPETGRYNVHNSLSIVTRWIDFIAAENVIQICTRDFFLLYFFPVYSYNSNLPERLFLSDSFLLTNCRHSLLLCEFSVAREQNFKVLHKIAQTKFTTSFPISLPRKLCVSAKQVCWLHVTFLLLIPTSVPFLLSMNPCSPRLPDIPPSLLWDPAKRSPYLEASSPYSQPVLHSACPLADTTVTWGPWSRCRLLLGPAPRPGTHDRVYLEVTQATPMQV